MKKIIIILISVFCASCTETVKYCTNHDESEIEFIEKKYNSPPERNLLPLSKISGIIQYHGSDSWGWFDHTIRIVEKDGKTIIQLIDNRNDPITKMNKCTYREIELTKKQIESINSKTDDLLCKSVNLEPGIGIDGSFYELIIKRQNKLQAFRWQTIFLAKDLEQQRLKDEVTKFVGDLMSLSNFPNGTKQIIKGRNNVTKDSIEIEVFPANQYNIRESEVYLDNKLISQNIDGIAELTIHKKDTIGINNRIKIIIELLNGETIEM
jgi:hypothetical protein